MEDAPGVVAEDLRARRAVLPVLFGGLLTSALTLAGVWAINEYGDTNPMGWYANRVIPIGALFVGTVAGCGYGIMSWRTGVKVSRGLLWTVLLLQVLVYFVALYVEFWQLVELIGKATGKWADPVTGFVGWFDFTTRSFAWKETGGKMGAAMGAWGYGIRSLEVIGFALGGLIIPAIMKTLPYCDSCGVYMKTKSLGWLPAGVLPRKVNERDAEAMAAYEHEHTEALTAGLEVLQRVREMAAEGKVSELRMFLDQRRPEQKEYSRLTTRIECKISRCPLCHTGFLSAAAFSGQGNEQKIEQLGASPASQALEMEVA